MKYSVKEEIERAKRITPEDRKLHRIIQKAKAEGMSVYEFIRELKEEKSISYVG